MSSGNNEKVGVSRQQGLFFAVIVILMLAIGLWVVQLSGNVTTEVDLAKNQNIRLANVAQQMRVDVIQIQQWLTDISATRGKDGLNDGFDEAKASYDSFRDGLRVFSEAFAENKYSTGDKQLGELQANLDAYYGMGRKMAQAYIDGGPAAGNLMMSEFDTAAESMYDALNPFVDQQVKGMITAMDNISGSVGDLRQGILTMFSIALIVMVGGTLWQNRSNSQRMQKILESLQQAAEGDLGIHLDDSGKDEMSKVATAFNRLIEEITKVIEEVKYTSETIFTGTQEMSSGAIDLSQRTEEQASSLEETASSMQEMTTTVKQNADSAQEASKLAQTARNEAEKGGKVVQDAIVAMDAITQSSSRITEIISTIDSIAFQTNLLALNAAVEAARAGDQGRGFAVVAAEVRTLAQNSADAAKEIKVLIDDSAEKVGTGTELVNHSGETLTGILDGVKKVADIVAEISSASAEQSSGIEQVNRAVVMMDDMTQQNASLVEQSAAASRSMEEKSGSLVQVVSFFTSDRVH